jgi:tripartite ATP-independent transporter DctP family solute receptor
MVIKARRKAMNIEKRRKVFGFMIVLGLLSFVLCLTSPVVCKTEEYRIRVATIAAKKSLYAQCLYEFAKMVEEKTDKRVRVEVYPDSILGNEREMVEMLRLGSIEMAVTGAGALVAYAPATGISELPYLFESRKQGYEAIMSVWDKIVAQALPSDIRIFAPLDAGERIVASKKPIRSIEDMKGLKIRVPESKMFIGTFKALGCAPTPVPFPDIYMALQTGVVDAADGPSSQIYLGKHHEQTKYIVMTKHIRGLIWIVVNNSWYQNLPDEIRDAVKEATQEAAAWHRAGAKQEEENYLRQILDYGLIKLEPDLRPFEEATAPFRKEYTEGIGPEAVEILEAVEQFKATQKR